jgi:hypothetical protein
MIGISERQSRRGARLLGITGPAAGVPSKRRVPKAEAEQVLSLYRDKYFDLNVRHFHEKLRENIRSG